MIDKATRTAFIILGGTEVGFNEIFAEVAVGLACLALLAFIVFSIRTIYKYFFKKEE